MSSINIKTWDTFFLRTSFGWVHYDTTLRYLDFVEEISNATLMTIDLQKQSPNPAGVVIERKKTVYLYVQVGTTWVQTSKGSNIDKCGKSITADGSPWDNALFRWADTGVDGNATYSDDYAIGTSNGYFWDWCGALDGSEDLGIVQRHNISPSKVAKFKFVKVTMDGELELPTAPMCGDTCGREFYIVNEDGFILTANDACNISWKANTGLDDQKWYSEEGVDVLNSFRVYYSKSEFTALVRVRDESLVVMELACNDYIAPDYNYREWRYESSTETGFKVLRLHDSALETGEWYLGRDAEYNAVVVSGVKDAIHLSVSESPFYVPVQDCEPRGERCFVSADCCKPLACNVDGLCDDYEEEEEIEIKLWVWALIIVGGLLFMYVIYKMASLIGKLDTSTLFEGKAVASPPKN